MATTIPTAAAQVGNGRTPHRVRTDGFHAKALCTRTVSREFATWELAKLGDFCKSCEKALAAITAEAAEETPNVEAAAAEEVVPVTAPASEQEAPARIPAVHRFGSTGEAYDMTQCSEGIHDGDLLVIEPERVVGFLRAAWPVAITAEHGELHTLTVSAREINEGAYAANAAAAETLARELGYDVNPLHANPAAVADEEMPACAAPEQPAQETGAAPVTFTEGDRVMCQDGLVRTALRTEVKDGKAWVHTEDRSAWPVATSELIDASSVATATADALYVATTLRATAAAPDPAALAKLGDALQYLRHADPAAHAALIDGADGIAVRIPRADLAPGDVLHDQGPHNVLDVCTIAMDTKAPAWWALILGHTEEVRSYTGREPWAVALRLDLARTDEVNVERPLPGISPTPAPFIAGDRIVCADGTDHTVRAMSPLVRDEPARVVVEDGTEWIAENCRRANPCDVAEALAEGSRIASRVTVSDTDNPEWQAALAELTTTLEFLKAVDPISRAALVEDEAKAAVLAIHAEAHDFQPFAQVGDPVTVGWSFSTGHGASARYGIVMTDATLSPVGLYEYRATAERAHLYADHRFTAAPITA